MEEELRIVSYVKETLMNSTRMFPEAKTKILFDCLKVEQEIIEK